MKEKELNPKDMVVPKLDPRTEEDKADDMQRMNLIKMREDFSNIEIPEQKVLVRCIDDTVLCNELQRRLLGRKLSLNTIEKVAENVKLTDL